MVEALGIIIDRRRPKGRPRKRGNFNHRKNRMYCPILIKKIEGEEEKWYCKTWPHNPLILINFGEAKLWIHRLRNQKEIMIILLVPN